VKHGRLFSEDEKLRTMSLKQHWWCSSTAKRRWLSFMWNVLRRMQGGLPKTYFAVESECLEMSNTTL